MTNHTSRKSFVYRAQEREVLVDEASGTEIIKVSPEESDSIGLATSRFTSAGSGIAPHSHEDEDEVFFVHRGSGTFLLGEERVSVGEGDIVFIPKGEWHGFQNGDEETIARMGNLSVTLSTASPDVFHGAALFEG